MKLLPSSPLSDACDSYLTEVPEEGTFFCLVTLYIGRIHYEQVSSLSRVTFPAMKVFLPIAYNVSL